MGKMVGARVYNSGNISVATSGVSQALTFDSERYDTDTIHDTSTNTSRLTCQTAGKYLIQATIRFAANATGDRQIWLRVDGTTAIASMSVRARSAAETDLTISTEYALTASQYVEIMANQTSGGPLNVEAVGNMSPEFMMRRIG